MKHEAIVSADEATRQVMEDISKDIVDTVAESIGSFLKNIPPKIDGISSTIEQALEKLDQTVDGQKKLLGAIQKYDDKFDRIDTIMEDQTNRHLAAFEELSVKAKTEIIAEQEKIVALMQNYEENLGGHINTLLINQAKLLEKADKIEERISYIGLPFFKKIFSKMKEQSDDQKS
jgi:hypothetical protein